MILTLTNFLRFSHSIIFSWLYSLGGQRPPRCWGFEITLRHTTLGRTPLDEWSARRRNVYLTTHNTHKRQTTVLPASSEPAIPASERPQTHALGRAATGIGMCFTQFRNSPVTLHESSQLGSREVVGPISQRLSDKLDSIEPANLLAV